jgi:hypothetical protein
MATFPTTPLPTSVEIKSINQVYSSMFQNYGVEKKSNGAQRWEITLNYPVMNFAEGKALFSFLMARRGSLETFDFSLPSPLDTTSGVYTSGTLTVNSGSAIVGSTIEIDGLPVNTDALKAGDLVQFSNHEKTYMLTADVDGTGTNDTMTIMPPLHVPIVAGTTTMTVDNVVMKMSLMNKDQMITIDENTYYNLTSLKIIETYNVPVEVV